MAARLWFLVRRRRRRTEIYFIDARKLDPTVDRTQRELTGADIVRIADTDHASRTGDDDGALLADKVNRSEAEHRELQGAGSRGDAVISQNLKTLGFGDVGNESELAGGRE